MPIELRPFGFTATESLLYNALLERGYTSAYGLGKTLGMARANVYQALNGLVAKGAAVKVSDKPQVFRPVGGAEVLALITRRHSSLLDQLESQVASLGASGEPATVQFAGQREFGELALRVAARSERVICIAIPSVLKTLVPIWRKRASDGTYTELWTIGAGAAELPISAAGTVDPSLANQYFAGEVVLLLADSGAIAGRGTSKDDIHGLWSSDPLLTGLVLAAAAALTTG